MVAGLIVLVSLEGWAEFQLPPANELDGAAALVPPGTEDPDVVAAMPVLAVADQAADAAQPAEVELPTDEQSPPSGQLFPPQSPLPAWIEDDLEFLRDLLLPVPEADPDQLFPEEFDAVAEIIVEPAFDLPAASALGVPAMLRFSPAIAMPVSGFVFEGNTAFSDNELSAVVESFLTKKDLTSEDLQSARLALTEHYIRGGEERAAPDSQDPDPGAGDPEAVADGYINSGALLPDQNPADNGGVVKFKIVEGELTRVQIEWVKTDADGNPSPARKNLWDHYLTSRIRRAAQSPLHMGRLREQLQLLQKNPNVRRLNAELKPDANPGESYLHLKVEPAQMIHSGIDFHNARSPSVGSEQLEFWLEHTSLTRHSDRLSLRYGLFERGIEAGEISGASNFEIGYTLPFTRIDTMLDLGYKANSYAVIEEPFTVLGIEGRTETWRAGLRQPLVRTEHDELTVGLHLEKRHTETSLLDLPFSLTPGAIDGEIDLSALRFSQEWIHRELDAVFALRSVFSIGIDAFDPTDNGSERDAEFLAWLGQGRV